MRVGCERVLGSVKEPPAFKARALDKPLTRDRIDIGERDRTGDRVAESA